MALKNLISRDFVSHYSITAPVVTDEYWTGGSLFEIEDKAGNPIVPYGQGKVRFGNVPVGGIDVFAYERFIDSTDMSFQRGLRRCDYILTSHSNNHVVCLLELTSAYGTTYELYKSKSGAPRGKIKKVEVQLFVSLQKLLAVSSIASDFYARRKKICLAAYRVYKASDETKRFSRPMDRYLAAERRETKNNGACIFVPKIEALGFEYRRITHGATYRF